MVSPSKREVPHFDVITIFRETMRHWWEGSFSHFSEMGNLISINVHVVKLDLELNFQVQEILDLA